MGIIGDFRQFRNWSRTQRRSLNGVTLTNPYDTGVRVDNGSATKLTAFYSAIRLRSENIASLPKSVKRETDKGELPDRKHPVNRLVRVKPNGYTNTFNFWFSINASLDGWGNAYAIIERDSRGNPVALHQTPPQCVSVKLVDGVKMYRVLMLADDRRSLSGVYSSEDMLHFMLVSFNGITGVNPVEYNAIALGKALAVEKYGADYYRENGEIKAVLETEKSLGQQQYDKFIKNFNENKRNFGTPLLEYGIKYKSISVSPVTAQLIQSQTFSIDDIARIMNVPPHMLCEMSHSTFSNIEHQTMQFVQFSLRPTLKRIETELEGKLFFDDELDKYSIKFGIEGLLRGDSDARGKFYHAGINDGWLSRNEARKLEGLPELDGLDQMLYPLNLAREGEPLPAKSYEGKPLPEKSYEYEIYKQEFTNQVER